MEMTTGHQRRHTRWAVWLLSCAVCLLWVESVQAQAFRTSSTYSNRWYANPGLLDGPFLPGSFTPPLSTGAINGGDIDPDRDGNPGIVATFSLIRGHIGQPGGSPLRAPDFKMGQVVDLATLRALGSFEVDHPAAFIRDANQTIIGIQTPLDIVDVGTANTSLSLVWRPHINSFIATGAGIAEIQWNSETATVFVSGAPFETPEKIYWTEEQAGGQTGAPRIDLSDIEHLTIHYNRVVPEVTGPQVLITDQFIFRDSTGALHAKEKAGLVVLEYNRVDPTFASADAFIGVQLVRLTKNVPDVFDAEAVDVGTRLRRSPQFVTDVLSNDPNVDDIILDIQKPIVNEGIDTQVPDDSFVYQHPIEGLAFGHVYAIRPTGQGDIIELYFMHVGPLEVEWPTEMKRFTAHWPAIASSTDPLTQDTVPLHGTPGHYQIYAKGETPDNPGPDVMIPKGLNPLVVGKNTHDDPGSVRLLPPVQGDFEVFTTELGPNQDAAFSLLLYQWGPATAPGSLGLAFEVVRSVRRTNVAHFSLAALGQDVASEILNSSHQPVDSPGFVYVVDKDGLQERREDRYDPGIFADTGQIFPVNTGNMEVWWSNVTKFGTVAEGIQWWSDVRRYDNQWNAAPNTGQVVVANSAADPPEPLSGSGILVNLVFNVTDPNANPIVTVDPAGTFLSGTQGPIPVMVEAVAIEVAAPPPPLAFDLTPLDFGTRGPSVTAPRPLSITNQTGSVLTGAITFANVTRQEEGNSVIVDPGPFSISAGAAIVGLLDGDTHVVSVDLVGPDPGLYQAELVITDDNGDEVSRALVEGSIAHMFTAAPLDFGVLLRGDMPDSPLAMQNLSGALLTGAAILDPPDGPFTFASGDTFTDLAANASQDLIVNFNPVSVGVFQAAIIFKDASGAFLGRTSVSGEAEVRISYAPAQMVFAAAAPNAIAPETSLLVTNNGGGPITVSAALLLAESPDLPDPAPTEDAFQILFGGNVVTELVLPVGDTIFTVRFNPYDEGVFTGTFEFTDTGSGKTISSYEVDGIGASSTPKLAVTPDQLLFDTIPFGQTQTKMFTVTNIGVGALILAVQPPDPVETFNDAGKLVPTSFDIVDGAGVKIGDVVNGAFLNEQALNLNFGETAEIFVRFNAVLAQPVTKPLSFVSQTAQGSVEEFHDASGTGANVMLKVTGEGQLAQGGQIRVPVEIDLADDILFYALDVRYPKQSLSFDSIELPGGVVVPASWPATPQTTQARIVISTQRGTGTLGLTAMDLYMQNDRTLPGFNPNEEHAVISDGVVFALRSDLNNAGDDFGSASQVLVKFKDDINPQKWDFRTFTVVAETDVFPFSDWTHTDFPSDPYEGLAGNLVSSPVPISRIQTNEAANTFLEAGSEQFAWKDRKGNLYARAAGSDGGAGSMTLRYFYKVTPDFFFPDDYASKRGLAQNPVEGDEVPWLDQYNASQGGALNQPIPVTLTLRWPTNVPKLKWAETLFVPKRGLPDIDNQRSVKIVYQQARAIRNGAGGLPQPNPGVSDALFGGQGEAVKLIDPIKPREGSVELNEVPTSVRKRTNDGDKFFFNDIRPSLVGRLFWDKPTKKLKFQGQRIVPVFGEPFLILNIMSAEERDTILALDRSNDPAWATAVNDLYNASKSEVEIVEPDLRGDGAPLFLNADVPFGKAITTGLAESGSNTDARGFVTLAFNDSPNENAVDQGLPITLQIIEIDPVLFSGDILIVQPDCPFDEEQSVLHTADLGGGLGVDGYEFEWRWLADPGREPLNDPSDQAFNGADNWLPYPGRDGQNGNGVGLGEHETILRGSPKFTLQDNWIISRYRYVGGSGLPEYPWKVADPADLEAGWSAWSSYKIAEGWIKRVLGKVNPFTQNVSAPGLAGAEQRFSLFRDANVNSIVSMISQAGERFEGPIALNCDILDETGLIQIYETVLERGMALSINGTPPESNSNVNNALLLVGSRLADLYSLLGNEAFSDAGDPTIGFSTEDGQFGTQATTLHAFMNQTSTLLEEELALLRGVSKTFSRPVYNHLPWNFTGDIVGGEVAYALNYNIQDLAAPAGIIDEADAKVQYPQGHGDAWGLYLTAVKGYYKLLTHPRFEWRFRTESISLSGENLRIDYFDERKFAQAAAAKARTGAEIVGLTYRSLYEEDPALQWQGYPDPTDENRAEESKRRWGVEDWGRRVGVGIYLDWAIGNALIPQVAPLQEERDATTGEIISIDPEGIARVERETVTELKELSLLAMDVQNQVSDANKGLNPVGIAADAVPFDIDPSQITQGKTHFEQIFERASLALNNAVVTFDNAVASSTLLRRQADSLDDFRKTIADRESDFRNRLIEIFGTPYRDDIGPGKTWPEDYNGADFINYEMVDTSDFLDNTVNVSTTPVSYEATLNMWPQDKGAFGDVLETLKVPNVFGVTKVQRTITNYFPDFPQGGFVGNVKPEQWASKRQATGKVQLKKSSLLLANIQLDQAITAYNSNLTKMDKQAKKINALFGVQGREIGVLAGQKLKEVAFDTLLKFLKKGIEKIKEGAEAVKESTEASSECPPKSLIAGVASGGDVTSAVRCGIKTGGVVASKALLFGKIPLEIALIAAETAKKVFDGAAEIKLVIDSQRKVSKAELSVLTGLISSEIALRFDVLTRLEEAQRARAVYNSAVARGFRLLQDRDRFREQIAGKIQEFRHKDMAFRIFRNDALQKYRAQFDLAARYVYLAARAYDYETNLLASDKRGAGQAFLTQIVKSRTLGLISPDGKPLLAPASGDGGLADPMARMISNWELALEGQLGFNNPQTETNRFSLRQELFRILPSANSLVLLGSAAQSVQDPDEAWRETLRSNVVANLFDITEFRRFAKLFSPALPVEPGIVIEFGTEVNFGRNFFGRALGGGDSAYDSSNFATKIRSVGVWFSNYNALGLSNTPRVYLIPVGKDIMRTPSGDGTVTRTWTVLDQKIPTPFGFNLSSLDDPTWIPQFDSLSDDFGAGRKFPSFRAFHDAGTFSSSETINDSRLIGRSVWNTRWLLIIPAGTLNANRDEGINRLIDGALLPDGTRDGNGISDIKLFFQTYAFSGSKKQALNSDLIQPTIFR